MKRTHFSTENELDVVTILVSWILRLTEFALNHYWNGLFWRIKETVKLRNKLDY